MSDCLPERWRECIGNFFLRGMLEAATSPAVFGEQPGAQLMNHRPCLRDCCATWSL